MRLTACFLVSFILTIKGNPISQEVVLREPFGYFSSPNYPDEYDNNDRKEWRIVARDGYHIKFKFTSFNLEDSYEEDQGPCVYDYVMVTDGNETLGRFCGNADHYPWDAPRINSWFHTKGKEARVVFVSDYSNEGINPSGFSLHYVEEDNDECAEMRYKSQHLLEDWDELIVCNHFCNNIPASYYCSCRNGFVLHENAHTCIAIDGCVDQSFVADNGTIQSPDYPNPYAKLSHCTWDIQVRDGLTVLLTFDTNFGVEKHDTEDCVYDILKVNGVSHCGPTAPRNGDVMDMNTSHVIISFTTDLSVEQQGFRINYTTYGIRCKELLTDPNNGRITTTNLKGYYEFEDSVTFECDVGYKLIGSSVLECLSDGTWSSTQPKCLIKSCGEPVDIAAIANSKILDVGAKRFKYGEIINVECNKWYEMTAGVSTWRCHENRTWVEHSTLIAPNPPKNYPKCRPICGKQERRTRREASQEAKAHEFPWIVYLTFGWSSLSDPHGCTGALISPRYVLTAAHCLKRGYNHVWLGVHDRTSDQPSVENAAAERIIIYTGTSNNSYDVGLIQLDRNITMNDEKRPICLPTASQRDKTLVGSIGVVAGWSLYKNNSTSRKRLFKGNFPVVKNEECRTSFGNLSRTYNWNLNYNVTDDIMFCAGYENKNFASTCSGDSGSPFMMKENDTFHTFGLVSFALKYTCGGADDGRIPSYTVYTRLTQEVIDWIEDETNELE